MLLKANALGYRFVGFQNVNKSTHRQLILRHDVDVSLDHAVRMAEIEHALGVNSTYFVMLHSPFYNLLDVQATRNVNEILDLGHEIGYHYDAAALGSQNPSSILKSEVRFVSRFFEIHIAAVSMHNPTTTRRRNLSLTQKDAYSPQFFSDMKYVSDSLQRWREGCLCLHLDRSTRIQALVHPFWWSKSGTSWKGLLQEHLQKRKRELDLSIRHYRKFVSDLRMST